MVYIFFKFIEKKLHINNKRIKNDLLTYIDNNYINNFYEKLFEN